VIYALMRDMMIFPALISRVEVAIPPGEAAAGDLNSEAMPGQEHVACRPEIDFVPVIPACSQDSVAKIERATIGLDIA
jgi:hypothetical protein